MNEEYYVRYNTLGYIKSPYYVILWGENDHLIGQTPIRAAASLFSRSEANEVCQSLIEREPRFSKNERVVKSRRKE